jgi:SRSO17 transposase
MDLLGAAVGHADRRDPLRAYLTGLLLPSARKSIEPMAARVDPRHVRARHQSMHHFVANAPWDARVVLTTARDYALAAMDRHGPPAAWVIDDTGMPKKGRHSVGVARQYCGAVGKQENCQVVVTLSLASPVMSVPSAYRLYLPEAWAKDRARRRAAGVPAKVKFQPKWRIALEELDRLLGEELPRAPVVADAGYGVATEFREAITARRLSYVMGVTGDTTVWPPGLHPLPPAPASGPGRPPKRWHRAPDHRPMSAQALAHALPRSSWKTVRWRDGTKGSMKSRFAAVRVRPAHRDESLPAPRAEEWLLMEWPSGESDAAKFWLSTVPPNVRIAELVRLAKVRWRIERDYQELKDELGLDHFEGRGWRGFHHHGVLCIAAYAFLAAERARLSPPAPVAFLRAPRVPEGFRPRGAPPPP